MRLSFNVNLSNAQVLTFNVVNVIQRHPTSFNFQFSFNVNLSNVQVLTFAVPCSRLALAQTLKGHSKVTSSQK